ncbi:MAG: hypothetical protein JXX14_12540 [Deltaproteobacteria bacterium]|nr:hypothetical protein [Deltaproteobacteria bacterium]
MMSQHPVEFDLKAARLTDIRMDKNRTSTRRALQSATEYSCVQAKKKRVVRVIFSMGVTFGFVLGIVCVWMLQPAPQPTVVKVATNLGSIWCTYSDNATGGSSVVWPPESTEGQNNFVKSAPGYGDKGYAVRFKGKAGERSREGFIGVSTRLGPPCQFTGCNGVNIQKFNKIRFKMKGAVSSGELVLLISNDDAAVNSETEAVSMLASADVYEAQITEFVSDEWRTVTLDLRSDFAFVKDDAGGAQKADDILADAKNLKWHVRNAKGADVDVWIDELEFF